MSYSTKLDQQLTQQIITQHQTNIITLYIPCPEDIKQPFSYNSFSHTIMKLEFLLPILLLITSTNTQVISEADFILGATYTNSHLWDNVLGLSIDYDNAQNYFNNTLYQAYHLNSNLKGNWANNFAVSIKTPLGHKYNCSVLAMNISNPNVTCTFQTQGNQTYWGILGQFIWNTVNQPNWSIGYDMQGVNLLLTAHQKNLYDWLYKVYASTYYVPFYTELVDYGDKMVERGYKITYSPENFTKDIEMANRVIYIIGHSGPGITEDASPEWLTNIQAFKKVSLMGHYTVRCIVFKDPTNLTIQDVLSDNATKYYLKQRFTVNQSYAYSDFSKYWLAINDIKLTTGDGVDGVTNTFAAALWAIDVAIEFCLMNGWEIDFNHQLREGNFQAILGPAPDFKPTPLYYGLIFFMLIRDNSPKIIIPATQGLISSKIKVFGFSTGEIFKVLLLNKDTNTSLNGTVLIKTQLNSNMKCVYLQAPALNAKDGVTISGYNFVGGNATVNGTYKQKIVQYDFAAEGYQIPIKYAQAVLCQTSDSIFTWPKAESKKNYQTNLLFAFLLLTVFMAITF